MDSINFHSHTRLRTAHSLSRPVINPRVKYHYTSRFKETGLPTSFEKVKELVTVLST